VAERDFENIQDDVRLAERHGPVRITQEPPRQAQGQVLRVSFEEIALKIAI